MTMEAKMPKDKFKSHNEWLKQAEYDLDTAEVMFKSGKYIYTIFMCHLSIEKALKGIYVKKLEKDPPKVHNLNYLCEMAEIVLPVKFQDFIDNLNNLSVPTRYPDELERLLRDYKKDITKEVLKNTKEVLLCLKQMF